MIETRITMLGNREIARMLERAGTSMHQELRGELAEIGDEIVRRAQANAPRRTGLMASRVAWFFGREYERGRGVQRRMVTLESANDSRIFFTVRPRGRVAHLVERGVDATVIQHARTTKREYERTMRIPARPWFMPSVEAMGGVAGVLRRLQARLDRLAAALRP
jgi:hypothetical protein